MSAETPVPFERLPTRFQPRRSTLVYGALLVNTEALLVLAYLLLTDVSVSSWLSVVYPFVWIDVGCWAIARTTPAVRSRRRAAIAGGIAAIYLLTLFVVGGLLSTPHAHVVNALDVSMLMPGTGPVVAYNGDLIRFVFVPFLAVGYVALAYLVYATLLDAAASAIGGAVGLVSCLSCLWPLAAPLLAGAFGSGAVTAAIEGHSYRLGTLAFVATVALLYWRPFERE